MGTSSLVLEENSYETPAPCFSCHSRALRPPEQLFRPHKRHWGKGEHLLHRLLHRLEVQQLQGGLYQGDQAHHRLGSGLHEGVLRRGSALLPPRLTLRASSMAAMLLRPTLLLRLLTRPLPGRVPRSHLEVHVKLPRPPS